MVLYGFIWFYMALYGFVWLSSRGYITVPNSGRYITCRYCNYILNHPTPRNVLCLGCNKMGRQQGKTITHFVMLPPICWWFIMWTPDYKPPKGCFFKGGVPFQPSKSPKLEPALPLNNRVFLSLGGSITSHRSVDGGLVDPHGFFRWRCFYLLVQIRTSKRCPKLTETRIFLCFGVKTESPCSKS